MNETKVKDETCTIPIVSCGGRCSDYDEDCNDVKDHFKCWLGGKTEINGKGYYTDTSDGSCPFIHHCN